MKCSLSLFFHSTLHVACICSNKLPCPEQVFQERCRHLLGLPKQIGKGIASMIGLIIPWEEIGVVPLPLYPSIKHILNVPYDHKVGPDSLLSNFFYINIVIRCSWQHPSCSRRNGTLSRKVRLVQRQYTMDPSSTCWSPIDNLYDAFPKNAVRWELLIRREPIGYHFSFEHCVPFSTNMNMDMNKLSSLRCMSFLFVECNSGPTSHLRGTCQQSNGPSTTFFDGASKSWHIDT